MAEKGRSPGKRLKLKDNELNLIGHEEEGIKLRSGKKALQLPQRTTNTGKENTISTSPSSNKASVMPPALVQKKVAQIMTTLSKDCAEKLSCIQQLNSDVFDDDSNTELADKIIGAGIVPRLVEIVETSYEYDMKCEALISMTLLAERTSVQAGTLIEYGAVPVLIQLLYSTENKDVLEYALSVLGNIAFHDEGFRQVLLKEGILQPLLSLLGHHVRPVVNAGVFCLSQLCQSELNDRSKVISVLCKSLHWDDTDVLERACWGLYLLLKTRYTNKEFIPREVCQRLVDLLQHEKQSVIYHALLVIEEIMYEHDEQPQLMLDCDLLRWLVHLLHYGGKELATQTCRVIGLVTGGPAGHIQAAINAQVFPALNNVLLEGIEEAKSAAVRAIKYAVQCKRSELTNAIARAGCTRRLCNLLNEKDVEMIESALESISDILYVGKVEACGSTNLYVQPLKATNVRKNLKILQAHETEEIRELATEIISICMES